MIYIEPGMFVKIKENEKGPLPYPLQSGFRADKNYRVLGVYNASETSEAYFILSNDKKQLWFISNRHLEFDRLAAPQDGAYDGPNLASLRPLMDDQSMRFTDSAVRYLWRFSARHKGVMLTLGILALYLVDRKTLKDFTRYSFNNLALNFSSDLLKS